MVSRREAKSPRRRALAWKLFAIVSIRSPRPLAGYR